MQPSCGAVQVPDRSVVRNSTQVPLSPVGVAAAVADPAEQVTAAAGSPRATAWSATRARTAPVF